MLDGLNRALDRIPRSQIRCGSRDVPAFRLVGASGFYAACIMAAASALVTRRSLGITAALAALSALSFFAYARLRRWIAGRESLVLLEHVWFTLACCATALLLARQPVLPYLDVIAPPLALFLAFGRAGCLLAGCCHGHPSSVGVIYSDGLFAGVRLFPVQALECVGLLIVSVVGFAVLPFVPPGGVLAWYLVAYAIMRFGLEQIRGDRRPYWMGLSQAQWMAMAEIVFAIFVAEGLDLRVMLVAPLVLAAVAVRWFRSPRRRLLLRPHLNELRDPVAALAQAVLGTGAVHPALHTTKEGAAIAVSWAGASLPGAAHISLSYRADGGDLLLLCELAAAAFPELLANTVRITSGRVLHFAVPTPLDDTGLGAKDGESLGRRLYAQLFRAKDREVAARVEVTRPAWFFNAGNGG